MLHLPQWHTDRVVVLGDAAHAVAPHSGQGASMAIEDAVVLGRLPGCDTAAGTGLRRLSGAAPGPRRAHRQG
nr:FAD-dependent monooxygenase [Mesorhizobium japonicum]